MSETDCALEDLQHLWGRLGCKIELPDPKKRFFAARGIQACGSVDERQFPRYYYRNKAFLRHAERWSAIYAKDVSHSSLGFIHCKQIFPCEEVQISFLNGTKVNLTVQRCRRLGKSCYECGGHIDAKDRLTTQVMRELIQG